MANEIRKEPFIGVYDGVTAPVLLEKGAISNGRNIRKVSLMGGWKGRKGCALNNTTAAESGAAIKSLHQYTNPIQDDYHFIAQINSKLLDATNDPPAAGTTFGTTLGVTVGTTPGFSTKVGEHWFYADGSGRPIVWSGTKPAPLGFFSYDTSALALSDYKKEVTDQRTDTTGLILEASDDYTIILTEEPCEGFIIDLGDLNSNIETMTVKAWRSGSWVAVSTLSDGTETGGATLAQDGTVTWDRSTSDTLKVVGNIMGYAYKIEWTGALSGTVTVRDLIVTCDANALTNKWNGLWDWVIGARFFDVSAGDYQESLGKISNESDSTYIDLNAAATGDYLYFKAPEPVTGVGLGIPNGQANDTAGNIDLVEYWDGDSWVSVGTLVDTTLDSGGTNSFSQTGKVLWDGAILTPRKRTFEGDDLPGYWYRISWDAALGTDTQVYAMLYAGVPESLPTAYGVVEFKGRLFTWEDDNRLHYSAKDKPFCFSGADSGYTDPFGSKDRILCAKKFYNELLIYKTSGVYLMEGFSPATFGVLEISNKIGISSPKTLKIAEVGYPGMHEDEAQSIAIWATVDGVYVLDGRKPKKISSPVKHFFDPSYTTAIPAADLDSLDSFVDEINNEYHLLTPNDGELVFNYADDEWYPPWDRSIDLVTGLSLKGTDGRKYTYGASSSGLVIRLETDTSDKNASNVDQIIQFAIKSRGFAAFEEGGITLEFVLRKIWAELKARTSGAIATKTFKNLATSGTVQDVPSAISMVNSGYALAIDNVIMSITNCWTAEVEFSTNTLDLEFEIWSMIYELEVVRPINQ